MYNNLPYLFTGPSGTGKTYTCLQEYLISLEKSGDNFQKDHLFLVPTMEHGMRIQSLLTDKLKSTCLSSLGVSTLSAFQKKLFEKNYSHFPISHLLKIELIKEAISKMNSFSYFSYDLKEDHFVLNVAEIIVQSKIIGLTPHDLRTKFSTVSSMNEKYIKWKMQDIAQIYELYQELLKESNLVDFEDYYARFFYSDSLNIDLPHYQLVVLDGFIDFSYDQILFLQFLKHRSKRFIITLTHDNEDSRSELFLLTHQTIQQLKSKLEPLEVVSFRENKRNWNDSYQTLERNLFSNKKTPSMPQEAIEIWEYQDRNREISGAVEQIMKLVKYEQVALGEICIVSRNINHYAAKLTKRLEREGIPYDLHERLELFKNPKVLHIKKIILVMIRDFKKSLIQDVLSSQFTEIPIQELNELNQSLQVSGYQKGSEKFFETFRESEWGESLAEFLSALETFTNSLSKKQTVAAWNHRFILLLKKIYCRLFDLEQKKSDHLAILRFEELLEELEMSVRFPIDGMRYLELLHYLINISLYSIVQKNRNAVQIYNVGNAKQKEYDYVLLLGLHEGEFPVEVSPDPLFSDHEKELLNQEGLFLKMRNDFIYSEKYFFYLALTRATKKTIISYAVSEYPGKPLEKSRFIFELERLFPQMRVYHDQAALGDISKLYSEVNLPDYLNHQILSKKEKSLPILAAIQKKEQSYYRYNDASEILLNESRELFQDPSVVFSASSFEKYQQCAFRYFAENLLGLDVVPEGIDVREEGELTHKVLEEFYLQTLKDIDNKSQWILMRDFDGALKKLEELFWRLLKEKGMFQTDTCEVISYQMRILSQLKKVMKVEAAEEKKRKTLPMYFEKKFGFDRPFYLELTNGVKVQVKGVVDRIDILSDEGTTYAAIIDYKGSKTVVTKKVIEGRPIQLFLYKKFAESLGFDCVAMELYPVKLAKRSGIYLKEKIEAVGIKTSSRSKFKNEQYIKCEENFLLSIEQLMKKYREANIEVSPENCDFCQMSSLCRIREQKLEIEDENEFND